MSVRADPGSPATSGTAVASSDADVRALVAETLGDTAFAPVRMYESAAELRAAVGPPPLAVVVDGRDAGDAADLVSALRHGRLTIDPFAPVLSVAGPAARGGLALSSIGADDVVPASITGEQLRQRIHRLSSQRTPFVVTSDYIGPERRRLGRPSHLGRIAVPSPPARGSTDPTPRAAEEARGRAVAVLRRARLEAHGFRLGFLSRLWEGADAGSAESTRLAGGMAEVLDDGAGIALDLDMPGLAIACDVMAARLRASGDPTANAVRAVAHGVVPAMRPDRGIAVLDAEAERAAAVYRAHPRSPFAAIGRIGATGAARLPVTGEGIAVECVNAGQTVRAAGAPADALLIPLHGSLGVAIGDDGAMAGLRAGDLYGALVATDDIASYRAAVVALEDSAVVTIPVGLMASRFGEADGLVRTLAAMMLRSLREVHALYTPLARHIGDSARQMLAEAAAIHDYVHSAAAPETLRREAGATIQRLAALTDDLAALIEAHPELDRRARTLLEGDRAALREYRE